MTRDVNSATQFYQQLLGWSTTEYDIPGHGKSAIFVAAGMNFGNPVDLDDNPRVPSHWISYIAVNDVEQSCEQAIKLGGKVCVPAFDIPSIGRTAVISDPVGSAFHVFTPDDKAEDMNMTGNEPGQICWLELMVDDPSKVIPFYRDLFGWKIAEPMSMNGGEYHSIEICGNKIAGVMKRPPQAPAMPPAWMPYMAVESVDETVKRVAGLDGKVVMPKAEIQDTGYFSLIEDPTGAHFYIFEHNL